MKQKYLFPLNYKYSTKFMGIIEYKILFPIAIYLGIIILLGLPPILILSVGVNGQPALP